MTNIPVTPQLAFIESPMQLLLIFLIIFVIFGAKKLPTMAKDIGRGIREFKKSVSGENDEDEKDEKKEALACAKCGAQVKPGNKFCTECGKPLA